MGSIREVQFETSDARFHVSVFPNVRRRGFTADYFGYTPKFLPIRSIHTTPPSAIQRAICNGNRAGSDIEKLVKRCRAEIEKRFGRVVTTRVVDRTRPENASER